MEVRCPGCDANLRINPNLAGTRLSCPQCGESVVAPKPERRAPSPRRVARADRETPQARSGTPGPRRYGPYTLWQLGSQTAIGLLGISCLAGAFFRGWENPEWSYFAEDPLILAAAGAALILLAFSGARFPLLSALAAAIFALVAGGLNYSQTGTVEASRVLALSIAMLALWLALQHRRAITPTREPG